MTDSHNQDRQGGEIEITPAMIEAGGAALCDSALCDRVPGNWLLAPKVAEEVYRAMEALRQSKILSCSMDR